MAKSTSDGGRWLSMYSLPKSVWSRRMLHGGVMWGPIPPALFNLLHDQETIMPSLPVTIPFAVVFAIWIIEIHAK